MKSHQLLFTSLVMFAMLCCVGRRAPATNVGGPITTNTTWTVANSPYNVVSTITLRNNATLTINPGVEVRFDAGLGMIIGHATLGAGTLKAIGTVALPIKFTSSTVPGAAGQWKDINFTDYCTDAAYDGNGAYVSGCILEHCIIEFGGGGTTGSTGSVTISQSSPFINFCEIRNSARSGIYANNSASPTSALKVKNSNIHNNTAGQNGNGGGVNLTVNGLVFTENTISDNSSTGGNFYAGGGGVYASLGGDTTQFTISGNTISNNSASVSGNYGGGGGMFIVIGSSNSPIAIASNTISGNSGTGNVQNVAGGGGVYLLVQSSGPITFSNNTVANNLFSGARGGGLYATFHSGGALLTVQNNALIGNLAVDGGGVCLASFAPNATPVANLIGNTIASNQAHGTASGNGSGGAVNIMTTVSCCPTYGSLLVNLTSNSFVGNEALGGLTGGSGYGGALYVTESDSSQQTIVTLAGNQSTNTYNTFADNTATVGDAIYNNMSYNRNGSNDIFAQYVCWGGQDPNPVASPNLIYDVYDNSGKSEVIADGYVRDPNCGNPSGCPLGEILDCNGNCAPASWKGDGVCDNGAYSWNGVPIYFNCPQAPFFNDGGDCSTPPALPEPAAHNPPIQPVYPPPPPPGPKLAVVVHGCCTDAATFGDFWVALKQAIDTNAPGEWQVSAYDWTADSGNPAEAALLPWLIMDDAVNHGVELGTSIAAGNYEHVHLIGHSAGCAVIAVAAYEISVLSPNTKIHTTFLDAFTTAFELVAPDAPWGGVTVAYGGHSYWSDQYFSRETLDQFCPGSNTGSKTEVFLPAARDVDVSFLDPAYTRSCLSSHEWPTCFYRSSVSGGYQPCAVPDEAYEPYGFHLSREYMGDAWLSNPGNYPPVYPPVILGSAADASGDSPDTSVFRTRLDAVLDLSGTLHSQGGVVSIVGSQVSMSTAGATPANEAWFTFQVATTQVDSLIRFSVSFGSDPGAQGLLTGYVDGVEVGRIDERYPGSPVAERTMFFDDTAPGTHTVSFRVDQFGPVPSSVIINNVQLGRSAIVSPGDINVNDAVNIDDLLAVINAWGPCPARAECPADIAPSPGGDGTINIDDLLLVVNSWGS